MNADEFSYVVTKNDVAKYGQNLIESEPLDYNQDGSIAVAAQHDIAKFIATCRINRQNGKGFSPTITASSPIVVGVLMNNNGRVSMTADQMNTSTAALRRYINERPVLKELVDSYDELRVEAAEKVLDDEIQNAEKSSDRIRAATFLLGTKGKERGYTQKMEVDTRSINISMSRSVFTGLESEDGFSYEPGTYDTVDTQKLKGGY